MCSIDSGIKRSRSWNIGHWKWSPNHKTHQLCQGYFMYIQWPKRVLWFVYFASLLLTLLVRNWTIIEVVFLRQTHFSTPPQMIFPNYTESNVPIGRRRREGWEPPDKWSSTFWQVLTPKPVFKAILQVLIYKALYDKSYLGSKTTMTSGEWTCLISFATAPLTCSERGGSEKFKMKINVSSGIRTHIPPVHDRKVAAP